MDQIKQYQYLSGIKPSYHKLDIPYHEPSKKRIEFNLKELKLYYDESSSSYKESKKKTGGKETIDVYILEPDY
jgi:hypothetical protein